MVSYPSVWFSTDGQFEAFDDAIRNTSALGKAVGHHRMRKGMAYVQSLILPWMRMPILIVATGELDVQASRVTFTPRRKFGFGWLQRNLRPHPFELVAAEIRTVERYDRPAPLGRTYDTIWARVATVMPAPLDIFYLAVGGRNALAMSRYREQSLALVEELQKLRLST